MRKSVVLLLVLTLVIVLASCGSSDYDRAMDLYNSENYSEALSLFEKAGNDDMVKKCRYNMALEYIDDEEYDLAAPILLDLGDYEDCKSLYDRLPWKKFYSYLKSEGSVEIKNTDPEYTVTLSIKGEKISASYEIEGTILNSSFKVLLAEGESLCDLTAETKFSYLGAYNNDKCRATWNISNYKTGDDITTWDEVDVDGKAVDGTPLTDGLSVPAATTALDRLTSGIESVLEESGLDIQMDDIGFNNY